jgi:hypothetical protein
MSHFLGGFKTHRKHIKNNTWEVKVSELHLERSIDMIMRFYLNYLIGTNTLIPGYDLGSLFDETSYYRDEYETS